jgi:uncharacterized protein involved in exopolysaccharide biosynthesis
MSPEVQPEPQRSPDAEIWPPASVGWLEVALPLWHRRWWLLICAVLGLVIGLVLALVQPARFSGHATFLVQPVQRPSQMAVANALPALAGLVGGGASPVDLDVAILRSEAIADRIIDRFELQRLWELPLRGQARNKLARRVEFGVGRREGMVQVDVEDENPQRAASMANEFIVELRATLRGFALDEARQRRTFYDAQLARARTALAEAQKELQTSGFDRAALRAEPRAVAESYGRIQAEVAASEVRLAATRRVRVEESNEVQQQLSELAALRAQLAKMEVPRDDGPGSFVARVREFRYAETLADSIARQAEAARVDEASDPIPLQVLDQAQVPFLPSSPRPLLWAVAGLFIGFGICGVWVLMKHRMALARLDPRYQQRLVLVRSVLPERRR